MQGRVALHFIGDSCLGPRQQESLNTAFVTLTTCYVESSLAERVLKIDIGTQPPNE